MKWIMIALVEFIVIIVVIVVAINYHDRLIASQNDIFVLSSEKENLRGLNSVLENDKTVLQNEVSSLKKDKATLTEEKTALEKKLKATLPYNSIIRQTLSLVNQVDTHNPSWSELKNFLRNDNTEYSPFVNNDFVCENFAVMLHDNAERKGIRAGVVSIDFNNDDVGHMINVFYTTDKGQIYIDDTGESSDVAKDIKDKCRVDTVAYLEKDKNYGTLDIAVVTSFDYSFYEDISKRWIQYNQEVEDYNNYIKGKTFVIGSAEEKKIANWSDLIDHERIGLPDCLSDSMGIVQDFEVRW